MVRHHLLSHGHMTLYIDNENEIVAHSSMSGQPSSADTM